MKRSRRSFVGALGAGVAAMGSLGTTASSAQLVYTPGDWHMAEFEKLVKVKARVKQVYDATSIQEGGPLSPMKNSFNGLRFGFGIPADQIKIVGAFRGQANLMNFDDSMWEKYRLGEYTKTEDPETKKPATKNIFYPKDKTMTGADVNSPKSMYQDYSIEALAPRGLTLLSCHNATNHQAAGLIKKFGLTATQDEIVKDLQAHMIPGAISVPAMVAALAILQCEGGFAYCMG
jgi:hypothetical protein